MLPPSYVVCAGYQSLRLLASLGLSIPLLAIKAYSLHVRQCQAANNWRSGKVKKTCNSSDNVTKEGHPLSLAFGYKGGGGAFFVTIFGR